MAEENPYAPPETVVNDDIRNIAVRSIPHRGNYASRWARLGGALIDVVVLVIAALAVDYLVIVVSALLMNGRKAKASGETL
ncbi:hypothetical protein N9133_02690 [Akkermansiaceae bacterium]|nr:hypothetical protein [Akkermansiaceae bacterium]MDB4458261.1 hypothetical protein [Akkermansiaceae bacterium]MDB4462343.1 hypothetical protein [Akkermansiaceae bacterium]MDB4508990.1 hypothetical protein [Akkermansiaceae bacterium]MDB4545538.1 hypothetical protein [Akkermansiaceae bacterium]